MRACIRLPTVGLACLALLLASSTANAQKLWSERAIDSPLVTQIPNFRALAEQVIPSVVSIQVEQRVRMNNRRGQDPSEFFHRYFGGEMPREYLNRGLGTGFVIDSKGLILTNYHVIENADRIEVTFAGKGDTEKKMTATVLGTAPEYDVALIATTEDAHAPFTYLGNSDKMEIGDWVMAVGNPFGLSHSVSVGIISAKERRDIMPSGRRGLYNFLQTDASINPGNSGGPLIDVRGQVIGINSAVNASGSGIGFAIPINMVKEILPDLKAKGKFTRSWIGIKIQALTPELAQGFGLKNSSGALVSEVVAGGPAQEAGLRPGDVVLEFDNKKIRESSELPLFASTAGVGKRLPLRVWRDGKELTLYVKLTEFPDEEVAMANTSPQGGEGLGLTVADITPMLQQQMRLEAGRGVVIKDIEPGGIADRSGLQPGDIIASLNGKELNTARSFAEAVRGAARGSSLLIKVRRQDTTLFAAMRKP